MKTLFIECNMGATGSMLMAALAELACDKDGFIRRMNELNIPGASVRLDVSSKCGIVGSHMSVIVDGGERESWNAFGMAEIWCQLNARDVSQCVKDNAAAVYQLLAEAESHVCGKPIEETDFTELGAPRTLVDIVGVCLLMEQLAPEQVIVSPVHVGCGQVRCAHGILPVPTPTTAHILRNVPIYGGAIQCELCTSTAAALLKHFADQFGAMPVMRVADIGYGMGEQDFEAANCVRASLGHTQSTPEEIVQLSCNLDDMTAEAIGYAQEVLFKAGARDVFTVPVGMKKSRPGILLACICTKADAQCLAQLMLLHTTTLGVREVPCQRYTLSRKLEQLQTKYGSIRVKIAHGEGISKAKPEYEDIARAAREYNVTLEQVTMEVRRHMDGIVR